MHQVTEFLSFTVGLVVAILKSLHASLASIVPAPVWVAAVALVLVLFLYSRLSSRIEEVEMTLVQLDAKLDTILSRLARPRGNPERQETIDRSRT